MATSDDDDVQAAAERAKLLLQVDQLREEEPRIRGEIQRVTDHIESVIETPTTTSTSTTQSPTPSAESPGEPPATSSDPTAPADPSQQ